MESEVREFEVVGRVKKSERNGEKKVENRKTDRDIEGIC